jgi:hypothetical protein
MKMPIAAASFAHVKANETELVISSKVVASDAKEKFYYQLRRPTERLPRERIVVKAGGSQPLLK